MPKLSSLESFKENLQEVLFHDPDFRARLVQVLKPDLHEVDQLATREDIQALREDSDKRFEATQANIQALREESNKRFEATQANVQALREESNKRFEAMREDIQALREDSNKRFEATQADIQSLREEVRQWRAESNERFAAAHQETLDLRKEMNERFEALHREMDERFEKQSREMNERFEALHREMDERFEKQSKETHRLLSALGGRWGPDIEGTFRALTQELVEKRYGGVVQKWRRYVPEEKEDCEIDLVVHNGEQYAVEIKASVSKRELYGFLRSCRWYEALEGKKLDRKILASPYVPHAVKELARDKDVEVFTGEDA